MFDIFQIFTTSFTFIFGNDDFTYAIDEVNVIIMFLLLPRVSTLGKWTQ